MRPRVGGIFAAAVALLAGAFFYFWSGRLVPVERSSATPAIAKLPDSLSEDKTANPSALSVSPSPTPDPTRTTALARNPDGLVVWPGAASASAALNQRDQSSRDDIAAVHTMLADYHSVFAEVPAGGLNEEITRDLLGENAKRIVFLIPKSGELNVNGELLDRWGTPYFFHKLSRDVIDLRSAGPDRKMFTPDDTFEETADGPPR